ncbi:MAG: branched-chain amino acid ABC transporter permease [Candidatus Dormibacteraeota bacterium]|nr:branched-chain amino acid ABC transporter permease [Candidatus Dormibacteraeota bacterium]
MRSDPPRAVAVVDTSTLGVATRVRPFLRHARLPVLLVAASLPLITSSEHVASVGRTAATYGVLALGYAVVFGLCGQFTMAHAALYGVGAYAVAILCTVANVDPWAALPAAVALATVAGAVVGLCALRVGGDLLAVVTLAIGQLVQLVMLDWTSITGGNGGIVDIPALHLAGTPIVDERGLYVVAVVALVGCVLVVDRLKGSRVGLAMEAVRDDAILASSAGARPGTYKVVAFAVSGSFAGVAGWLEATAIGAVSPPTFDVVLSVLIAVMVLLAGRGRVYAVIAAAAFIAVLQDLLSSWPTVETACVGVAIVLIVLYRSGALRRRWTPLPVGVPA